MDTPVPHATEIPVRAFRRQAVTFTLLMCVVPCVLWGAGSLVIWLAGIPWSRLGWLWAVIGPFQVGVMIWWFRSVRVMARRVRETDGVLCPGCGYDLRERGDPELCSECGLRVTDDEAVHAWRYWRKVKRRYDPDVVRARQAEEANGVSA